MTKISYRWIIHLIVKGKTSKCPEDNKRSLQSGHVSASSSEMKIDDVDEV